MKTWILLALVCSFATIQGNKDAEQEQLDAVNKPWSWHHRGYDEMNNLGGRGQGE